MYEERLKTRVIKEQLELEKQVNELIFAFENKWKAKYVDLTLVPIPSIKNSLPYNQQKGGKVQFFMTL
ncbi:hypothetical protein [Pedobacter sp. BMA]|uniref:hypothetical protein n=1 Tax=Pedobacter sp. BMA TaxID=1663685 RepID=UPI00064B1E9B|nr:hypothetical protein [Pedobacter sp. BMA]KLT64017.1 hypothetical protein AB669_18295 [Pedobacter sp. BMA]